MEKIEITYRLPQGKLQSSDPKIIALLDCLEKNSNLCHKPYAIRGNNSDLVSIAELIFTVVTTAYATAYAKGFFGVNKFTRLGESHRIQLKNIISISAKWFQSFFSSGYYQHSLPDEAITRIVHVEDISINMILNYSFMNDQLMYSLPNDEATAIGYLYLNKLSDEFKYTTQLLPNPKTGRWDKLLLLKKETFCFVDLEDGNIKEYDWNDDRIDIQIFEPNKTLVKHPNLTNSES